MSKVVFYNFVFLKLILGEVKVENPENVVVIEAVDDTKSNTCSLADTVIESNSDWPKSDEEIEDIKIDSDHK